MNRTTRDNNRSEYILSSRMAQLLCRETSCFELRAEDLGIRVQFPVKVKL